jgi:hypothetical protein
VVDVERKRLGAHRLTDETPRGTALIVAICIAFATAKGAKPALFSASSEGACPTSGIAEVLDHGVAGACSRRAQASGLEMPGGACLRVASRNRHAIRSHFDERNVLVPRMRLGASWRYQCSVGL